MNIEPEQNPAPSVRKPKKSNSSTYLILGALIVFILFVALFTPVIICSPKNPDRTEAINNARQIGLALFVFESEYGSYPNDTTVDLITKKHPGHGHNLTSNSSNAAFRQLFAAKLLDNEAMFYAKIKNAKRPDGDFSPRQALKKGECNFAYISGLSTAGNPSRPLALTPLIPGTTKFDPKPFDGKAIILRIDNSVSIYSIRKDGHIYDNGIDILSPEHPFWKGKAPDIRYPE